ncbi:hypothetical protein ANN_26541 [Periplaneta americana]|uniref:Uncharacterized protein n=1 Tax=Periplaneta americana TaxID=6978 RepID=A0ABQ8RYK5_PERAM|nr:hypothetical protein ANN_26541 [Periplaneta americana]
MAGLCEGGNEPPGSLKAKEKELAGSLVEKELPTEDALEGMVNERRVRGKKKISGPEGKPYQAPKGELFKRESSLCMYVSKRVGLVFALPGFDSEMRQVIFITRQWMRDDLSLNRNNRKSKNGDSTATRANCGVVGLCGDEFNKITDDATIAKAKNGDSTATRANCGVVGLCGDEFNKITDE